MADYSKMPKADIILLTHEHHDHLDLKALEIVRTGKSLLILTETCATRVKDGIVMKNGDIKTLGGLIIEAVPAYNLAHMRSEGVPYHPKGIGNGYVITFGDKKVYVAGDTENTPEMKGLTDLLSLKCRYLQRISGPTSMIDLAALYNFGRLRGERSGKFLRSIHDVVESWWLYG